MLRRTIIYELALAVVLSLLFSGSLQAGERTTLSLDGTWEIEDSISPDQIPSAYGHHVHVPGLAHLSVPPFADVDQFESFENHRNRVRFNRSPGAEKFERTSVGIPRQNRNYFWYRKSFTGPPRQAAWLRSQSTVRHGSSAQRPEGG